MRRLAFLLILLLLIPSISQARPRGIFKTVASGTVTKANMRLSGVDGGATASGGAFVDFGYKYQSDFSAGADGWVTISGTTLAGNIDSIGGEDNVLRVTCDTSDGTHTFRKPSITLIGKRVTTSFKVFIPSSNSIATGFRLRNIYWGGSGTDEYLYPTPDTWVTYTRTFTVNTVDIIFYLTANGSDYTFQDAGGDDVFYIKDVKIEENPPTSYIGHLLKITDSAGKSIMGYIKAAGSAEGLASETLTNSWVNIATSPYETFTASGADITQGVNSADNGFAAHKFSSTLTAGGLYKYVGTLSTSGTLGTSPKLFTSSGSGTGTAVTIANSGILTLGVNTLYTTISVSGNLSTYLDVSNNSSTSDFGLTNSLKQVLTPSATGVTIVSSKGGATYNWFNKNSAFNWNDVSDYTYTIYKKLDAPIIDSDLCASGDITINMTAGSASFAVSGIDDSAYQTGYYILALYDVNNIMAYGYYKASGSGAVVSSLNGATQNFTYIGAGFNSAGNITRKILYVGN